MSEAHPARPGPSKVDLRAAAIYSGQLEAGRRMVDRMFTALLALEWMAWVAVALIVSPRAWAGESGRVHPDVWTALVLGGLSAGLPIALTLARPGRASTRQCVAVGQMLMVALLIHLSGGRPEAHFHVFGSLAFLALYRDWRVMVTASVVVALDHYFRGVYFPRSVFGALGGSPWRWAEHSLWVAFEVAFLVAGMARSLAITLESARGRAEVEATRDRVEAAVLERTAELRRARSELEDRVRGRTAELQEANDSLRVEVADRLKAEVDLRASEGRFRAVSEAMPQVVWVADAEGRHEYLNSRWYRYTGLSEGQSLGRGWIAAVHPDDRDRARAAWDRAVSEGSDYQVEYRLRGPEGGPGRWHLARGLPIRRDDGSVARWIGTCADIDDQEKAAEALRRAHDQLEARVRERTIALQRANADLHAEVAERRKAEAEAHRSREAAELATRAKSEFLANMSHEIRTPMNAIIGMTELTLGMELGARQGENLEVVRVAADSLLELIDDILDFSKIEAGKLDIDPIRFHPREAVEAAVKTLSLRAAEKGLVLTASVARGVPDTLVGDPHRLRQVLINLLGNAIKFTATGRVEVRVGPEPEDADPDGLTLRFSVHDQGIGIPASRLGMIFDPFEQADGSTTRRYGGTGLGLSISSRLVELMEGRIWVESEVGFGSAFHFTARFGKALGLPAGQARPEVAGAVRPGERPPGVRRLRVLLVDDNELNRRVGSHHLERLGHDVRLAANGQAAVALCESEGPFDLIFMDVRMPGMDGFEATALIRSIQARTGLGCPIIALTAFAMKGDRERCLAGGMDDHLSKPVRGEDLGRLIGGLGVPGSYPAGGEAPRWSLDPDEVRSAMPMAASEMAEVVGLFRATCREQLASMRRAVEADDHDLLARAAHGLKGCLAMFASGATVALADGLEEAGASGRLGGVKALLVKLEGAIAGMQPTLDLLAGAAECSESKLLPSSPP